MMNKVACYLRGGFVLAFKVRGFSSALACIAAEVPMNRSIPTMLIFDHTGFPAGDYDSLDFGWHSHYWEPYKKFFA
jgi:hypothetical protein